MVRLLACFFGFQLDYVHGDGRNKGSHDSALRIVLRIDSLVPSTNLPSRYWFDY